MQLSNYWTRIRDTYIHIHIRLRSKLGEANCLSCLSIKMVGGAMYVFLNALSEQVGLKLII